jgi:hypothetical protein
MAQPAHLNHPAAFHAIGKDACDKISPIDIARA